MALVPKRPKLNRSLDKKRLDQQVADKQNLIVHYMSDDANGAFTHFIRRKIPKDAICAGTETITDFFIPLSTNGDLPNMIGIEFSNLKGTTQTIDKVPGKSCDTLVVTVRFGELDRLQALMDTIGGSRVDAYRIPLCFVNKDYVYQGDINDLADIDVSLDTVTLIDKTGVEDTIYL